MPRRPLALALALVGCGSDGVDATLAELTGRGIEVYVESAAVGRNVVSVRFDGIDERFPDDCPILGGDFAGKYRGRAMTVRERGGKGESACELPALEIDAGAVASNNVVEVSDDSLTMTATYEAAALTTRIATHESWQFLRGEPAAVDWSNAEDLVGAFPSVLIGDRELEGGANGAQIGFVVPADLAAGVMQIVVKSNDVRPDDANRCENAATCRAGQAGYYEHEVEIQ